MTYPTAPAEKQQQHLKITHVRWCALKRFYNNVSGEHGEATNASFSTCVLTTVPRRRLVLHLLWAELFWKSCSDAFFETFIGAVCLFTRLFILQPLTTVDPTAESFGAAGTNWDGCAESECSDLEE